MIQKFKIEFTGLVMGLIYLATCPFSVTKKITFIFQYLRLLVSFGSEETRYSFGPYKAKGYGRPSLRWLMTEIFIANEYYFHSRKKDPVIIDCGANIGLATLYFKSLYPASKIYAFEPDEAAFHMLKENIENNKLQDISVFKEGLSDSEKDAFFSLDLAKGSVINSLHRQNPGEKQKIHLIRLSDFIKKHELTHVDMLKVDIEGEEIALFHDLVANNCLKFVQDILVEYHHNIPGQKSALGRFIQLFEAEGYFVQIKTSPFPVGMKHRFQDVMIHAYRD
ncbi:MAG: FkbM family methyltransferase [bacterium]